MFEDSNVALFAQFTLTGALPFATLYVHIDNFSYFNFKERLAYALVYVVLEPGA
jgi:hypothetical protein